MQAVQHGEQDMRQDKEEQRQLIRETVTYMFEHMGLDISDPTELQRDFAHLRKLRVGSERIKDGAIKTCVGALITGLIYLILEGLRSDTAEHIKVYFQNRGQG
jgi:hypothetical protein